MRFGKIFIREEREETQLQLAADNPATSSGQAGSWQKKDMIYLSAIMIAARCEPVLSLPKGCLLPAEIMVLGGFIFLKH